MAKLVPYSLTLTWLFLALLGTKTENNETNIQLCYIAGTPVGSMKRILRSDWLSEPAKWAHLASSGLPSVIPRKISIVWGSVERSYKVFNFCTLSVIETQRAADYSQNRGNINDSCGRVFCATNKAGFFLALNINKLFLILNNYFCYRVNLY